MSHGQTLVAHPGLGKVKDGENVSGSINVPEVAHDTEPEEYVVCSLPAHLPRECAMLIAYATVRYRHLLGVEGETACQRPCSLEDYPSTSYSISETWPSTYTRTWKRSATRSRIESV